MDGKKFIALAAFCLAFAGCQTTKVETTPDLVRAKRQDEARARFTSNYDIDEVDENGNTALHAAAEIDDADIAAFLIIKGAKTEALNTNGDTPLHVAIANGSYKTAQTLVTAGANIFAKNADGITALELGFASNVRYYDIFITTKTGELRSEDGESIVHYFVKTKNNMAIQTCVSKGLPLSVVDNFGKTPLDIAFDDMNDVTSVEIAAELILGGADRVDSEFSYFYDAVSDRNLDFRFDDGQTPLHIAATQGHSAIVKYLLENDANTKAQDISGSTPLHEAARYGHAGIARMMMDAGADVNAEDNLGKTPIMLAITGDEREAIYGALISRGADVNHRDTYGDTALHTATMVNVPTGALARLVDAGADVNARNKDGVTPILIAAKKNNNAHVKFYAARGAEIHCEDTHGVTPLKIALADDDMLENLVNSSNVMSVDSAGNTALHIAILADADIEKAQYIISLMDNVNARNREGNSALYLAVLKHKQKLGELLLAKGADIFAANSSNYSPLRLALMTGGDTQGWLITSETIQATDGSGNTALHYAAEWGLADAVGSLVEKGADASARNANGETPMFSAVKANDPRVIDALVAGGASVDERDNLGSSPLHVAVRWDVDDATRALVAKGADVDAQNSAGKSPLAEAALAGKIGAARILMESGADMNSSDSSGRTILMDATRGQNTAVISMLLENGANPQIQDVSGRNAYHEAVATGNLSIINMMRDAGGNPLSRDKKGDTPFLLALRQTEAVARATLGDDKTITDSAGNTPVHVVVQSRGPLSILSSLIDRGYPFDTRNSDGMTPLSCAVESGAERYALVLLQHDANPFCFINKRGRNAAVMALEKNDSKIVADIVKYAGAKSDIHGDTILHYAAKMSDALAVRELLSYGLDKNVKNISGETPYMTATRWKKLDVAALLKNGAQEDAK